MLAVPAPSAGGCPARTTVLRRALLTVLFLGGLLLLGLALAGGAQAAEPTGDGGRRTAGLLGRAGSAEAEGTADTAVHTAVDTAVHTTDEVTEGPTDSGSAGDGAVADGLSATTPDAVTDGNARRSASEAAAGRAHDLQRAARELPGATDTVTGRQSQLVDGALQTAESAVGMLPQGVREQARRATAPVTDAVRSVVRWLVTPPSDGHDRDGARGDDDGGHGGARRPATDGTADSGRGARATAPSSVDAVRHHPVDGGHGRDSDLGSGRTPLPVTPPAPVGAPHSAHDDNGPRSDTPQATLDCSGALPDLRRGAVVHPDGTPTRERHRDVLAFPG